MWFKVAAVLSGTTVAYMQLYQELQLHKITYRAEEERGWFYYGVQFLPSGRLFSAHLGPRVSSIAPKNNIMTALHKENTGLHISKMLWIRFVMNKKPALG